MSKGIIVHLDDDKKNILDPCRNYFDQLKTNIEYVTCTSKEEFVKIIDTRRSEVKALIFDLVNEPQKKVDLKKDQTDFILQVEEAFEKLRVPIFIYSAHLEEYEGFKYSGTVFRVDKGDGEFESIAKRIQFFHESGFLDIFSPNGELDRVIWEDLHEAFVKQFNSPDDIEKIIKTISPGGEYDVKRIQNVFVRMAIRSLMSKLHLPDTEKLSFAMYNATEHYHKRISNFDFWTGDILKSKNGDSYLLIITPRCNVASKNHKDLLVCDIALGDFPEVQTSKDKKIHYALTDNPEVSGYNRYIPPSPVFKGGKVILSQYRQIDKTILKSDYDVEISLSDELTNEMLGKFGAYFFRTGITPWNLAEVLNQIAATK